MKRILSATDFSKNGNNATEYAAALAQEFRAKLILCHVYQSPADFSAIAHTVITKADSEFRKVADGQLEELKGKIEKKYKDVVVTKQILNGAASDTISHFAQKEEVDLIVVGSTGTTKLRRLLIGSNSAKLIQVAQSPVLCIPEGAKFEGIQRIVFATDLHEDNINAALSVITFARHFDSEISFLFVDDKHLIHSDESVCDMTQKIRQHVHYSKMSGYISKNTSIPDGIEFFLTKYNAQILVMLTHEKHLFSQSITSKVSHNTRIPLLALKKGITSLSSVV